MSLPVFDKDAKSVKTEEKGRTMAADLSAHGITVESVYRNVSPPVLYELALQEAGCTVASTGALIADSGEKTGRSPLEKRIVEENSTKEEVWWGSVNVPITEEGFAINKETAIDFLNSRSYLFCVDGFAGWDPTYKIKIRVICARSYHALFMQNMLLRPTSQELEDFGEPDWLIYNAGQFPANTHTPGVSIKTSVNLNLKTRELVILGSEYAGEMKKGLFTILNYLLPKQGVLSMHCSANEGPQGDTALFFGLSGTGKTTLSADPKRKLIGDDEHGWSDNGIFNFEAGCYAKVIRLTREGEPDIFDAVRFGTVLENVVFDPQTHVVDYFDGGITENTRACYPIEHIQNTKIPCVGKHPKDVIFLTCDAFGVLPPVSRLTHGQAMYHFVSGYTAKVAGTEVGITDPEATFSACFGAAFLVWHPTVYARLLRKKLEDHNVTAWLVNTGWTGGPFGVGSRMKIHETRTIIDAILDGSLDSAEFDESALYGLSIPKAIKGVRRDVLNPRESWKDKDAYDRQAKKLATLFAKNFEKYKDEAKNYPRILEAASKVSAYCE